MDLSFTNEDGAFRDGMHQWLRANIACSQRSEKPIAYSIAPIPCAQSTAEAAWLGSLPRTDALEGL